MLVRAQPGRYILRVTFADGNHLSKLIEVNEKNRVIEVRTTAEFNMRRVIWE